MLYFVATPIGNLKDITLRALETLKAADVIACEDTRHTLKLLNFYDIKKPLISYHKFNENTEAPKIMELVNQGKTVAVVSDAGMPVISDPGNKLTKLLRENDVDFTVVPGANAGLSALVLSGMNADKFCFYGFLDENKSRKTNLEKYKDVTCSVIFYVAPHNLRKDVKDVFSVFGERKACLVKEITKIHEKAVTFNLSEFPEIEERGEFVLIVDGAAEKENPLLDLSEKEHIDYYVNQGLSKMDALKKAAKERGVAKSELYKYTIGD